MRKIWYRLLCGTAAAALLLPLAACGFGASSGAGSAASGTAAPSAQQKCRTGLGVVVTAEAEERTGEITVTAAGVVLDEQGRILHCAVDAAEQTVEAAGDGTVTLPAQYATKGELSGEYGMKDASPIGREWDEQVHAFCRYVVGKTGAEVAALPTENGKAADTDLLSGCTIRIGSLQKAVSRACENAQESGAAAADTLRLAMVSSGSGTVATDDADGRAQVKTTLAVLTKDASGRVTSAMLDEVEPTFTVVSDGLLTAPETVQSKLELGSSYGMKTASPIGLEWDEQSRALCAYLTGKDAEQIAALSAAEQKADLAASCTIRLTDIRKTILKALED